jgi:NAD(P)-dependent dehydrogenase (short-subunit alcohol dehydrogenase family)
MDIKSSLRGKRVVVTAGAGGIGLEIARSFMAAGAQVLIGDVDKEAISRAERDNPGLLACRADVSSEKDVADLFATVDDRLGGLDVLVNNAGVAGPTGAVETLQLSDWEHTFAVNVVGQFLCVRAAVPRLRKGRNASIINLSSAAGHLGMPGRSPYSASKWAVIGFTKTLALELGRDGIRVNAILPGAVDGPRIRAVIAAKAHSLGKSIEAVTDAYGGQAALGRMIDATDIANMAIFVASDLACNVNGQELVVDGFTQALS